MLRNRTIAKTAIMPKAVMRLLASTIITSDTIMGMITNEFTKEREYERPEWVIM